MDDFYDTDIGVQTSDILVLPSAFLGTLWTELQNIGTVKARSIMFNCGHSVGSSLSVNYVDMGTEDLDMVLNQAWAEAGLGHLFVLDTDPNHIIVKLENLLEIGIIGASNNCDFTAGCLTGVLEGLLQQPYSVVEEMVGEETRLFKFDKK
jgi:predicted hydrocarbon binding protein